MAKCKSCGADIVWIETANGKAMPCDAEPVKYIRRENGKEKVVTPGGTVVSCVFEDDANKATGLGYKPHWSTCTAPQNHRRAKT